MRKTLSYSTTAACCIQLLARSVQIKYAHSTNVTSQRRMNRKDRQLKTSRNTLKLSGFVVADFGNMWFEDIDKASTTAGSTLLNPISLRCIVINYVVVRVPSTTNVR